MGKVSQQLTSAGQTNQTTVGNSGQVAYGASANTGAFSVILQANVADAWLNIGSAITTLGGATASLPPGTAVRLDATTVGTDLDLNIQT